MRTRNTSLTTDQKALAVNLDKYKYGSIVEIGAGQEVARRFFQVGAAAGTVAKTMSAYDMKFSDIAIMELSDKYLADRKRYRDMGKDFYDTWYEENHYRDERGMAHPYSYYTYIKPKNKIKVQCFAGSGLHQKTNWGSDGKRIQRPIPH